MFNSEHLQCFAITKDQLRQTLRIKDAKHFPMFFRFSHEGNIRSSKPETILHT